MWRSSADCVAVGLQANAVARGYTVRAIEVELEGDINITSVWGTGDLSPKPLGLTAVRVKAGLDIDGASAAELDELVAHAAAWLPVLNTVRNPVAVSVARV
jgi:organic hydroperoxide reductase OsmC/OhrA